MPTAIADGVTPSQILGVDATSKAARTTLYDVLGNVMLPVRAANTPAAPALLPIGGVNEGAWRNMRVDRYSNARVGFDQIHMNDRVEGATINTQIWTASLATFTQAQTATTGILFNSGAVTTASSSAILTSQRQFFKTLGAPLRARFRSRVVPATNAVSELGFGAPATNTAQITNGACWRYTSGGTVVPVLYWSGSDVQQGTDISSLISSANYYTWDVVLDDHAAIFTCTDSNTGRVISEQTLTVPITQPRILAVTHIPAFVRLYVTGSAASVAPALYLTDAAVTSFDLVTNKPWTHTASALALGADNNPTAFTSTAQWANSAAPASATLSNTAAGYTTLGGTWQFAAVAGAATDYALFGFTVPAPYTLYVTGVRIAAWNTGAAGATTPTLLSWGLSANMSAVSLASGAGRILPVGSMSFPVGAAIGANVPDLDMPMEVPPRTEPGRFFVVILRIPVGTATASQVIAGTCAVRGYFE